MAIRPADKPLIVRPRRDALRLSALLALWFISVAFNWAVAAPADCGAGMLPGPVELRDGQTGFAGLSGLAWTIDCEGNVTVARFLNEKTDAPHRTGRLSGQALQELASAFREQRFTDLTDSVGPGAQVNPRLLTLRYGEKTVTLRLPPGDPAEPDNIVGSTELEARFITLAQCVKRLAAASVETDAPGRGGQDSQTWPGRSGGSRTRTASRRNTEGISTGQFECWRAQAIGLARRPQMRCASLHGGLGKGAGRERRLEEGTTRGAPRAYGRVPGAMLGGKQRGRTVARLSPPG
jgi:hypothetical protein